MKFALLFALRDFQKHFHTDVIVNFVGELIELFYGFSAYLSRAKK